MRKFLALIVLLASCSGCIPKQHALQNYQPGIPTRVYIQKKYCADDANGGYSCSHVRFVPMVVRVSK